ncbi:MAG: ASKHA domain-containing protein [Candidatus Bathyarchaeia archaeon]
MPRLIVQPIGLRIQTEEDETILDSLRRSGIMLQSICGGLGTCGKCVIRVVRGKTSPPSEQELKLLSEKLSSGFRLACQTKTLEDVEVEIPVENIVHFHKVAIEGLESPVVVNPAVKEAVVEVRKPSLSDLKSDWDRVLEALKAESYTAPPVKVLRKLPSVLRESGWSIRVLYHRDVGVLDALPVGGVKGVYGLALDIGTTKLVAYLVNLKTGETEAVKSMLNPQISFGEDIISRITYASDYGRTAQLQRAVVEGINQLTEAVCKAVNISPQDIYEIVAVGNTAMHHILLGIPPKTLGLAPFTPVIGSSINIKASEIGLNVNESGNLYLPPVVAGFVGADAVADVLATRMYESSEPCAVVDIGTNTEIILNDGRDLYACSCASGPAFEGARIKHGMRAGLGAIETVYIDSEAVKYSVIGGVKPIGICGSGVVDALASLLDTGLLSRNGRFNVSKAPNLFIKSDGDYEFVVASSEESGNGYAITITQRDVREIQLAKSAIATGLTLLLRDAGVSVEKLSRIYLAGSFGSYINPRSAIRIGLLPNIDLSRVKSVGNTAGMGAKMCLISYEERVKAEDLAKRIKFVEFYIKPDFTKTFLGNLNFPA